MNDLDRWQQGNEEYLAASLEWLRLRLARLTGPASQTPGALAGSPSVRGPLFGYFQRKSAQSSAQGDSVAKTKPVTEAEVEAAASRMAKTAALDPPPALLILGQRLGLSRFEQEVLLLCAAMELDTRIATLCARAQDDPNRPYPTFALAMALFDEPTWDVLSPDRPLRHWRLLEINQPGAQPLTTSPLRADERIVNYLKGLNYLDDRLTPLLVPMEVNAGNDKLPPSQQTAVETIVRHLGLAATIGRPPLIQLVGPNTLSKQLVADHAAAALGMDLYRLPAELLPAQTDELETFARLWAREGILLPIALYLDAHEAGGTNGPEAGTQPALSLRRFLVRSNGLFFLDTRDIRQDLGRANLVLDVVKPTPAEQQTAWAAAVESANGSEGSAQLTGQFDLNVATIQQIAREVLANGANEEPAVADRLWEACLVRTRPRLDTLAQRLDPKAAWEDIVLPEAQMGLLHQIAAQVGQRSQVYDTWGFRQKMNRGLGISALFAGESGTGKTMAAEVIANDLRLNLYRIDLSAVVSKYIGETEKNLRKLFDAAEDGGAILFFDEADALFGKRSEIKDSHDRYANIEINYLLQRMEAYRGLAVLATNMKNALDQAFMRRLRFIVNFPFPGPADRQHIWQKVFPPETPASGLDFDRLARLNLTGGSIHNVALNAAFLAAQAGTPVTMPLVLDAARSEFRKLERPIREIDFRWEEGVG